ncbi:CoA transferase [Frankia sp. CNm7]|uniref:CoA transferase n=1 Tax=Frankia nepalensis TaxID=1836974 RepID=A0A937RKS3_9ACTN|nr:CoA transferase [Frankia nepalensis]MBL7499165.1 CoA transferase [Frankia nepalensis]MBL7511017.1 CoA transferase [Frankia nepalensis]MBL7520515.1 CoA transferase [Frankia nepalensis]MBL7632097.1 CoA transferase [Frankia nepalensis]
MTTQARWPCSPANSGRPLHGVKILDLSRVLAGPFCTMILADLGADVVKVEAPGGDETRRWGPPFFQGTAAYYFGPNRNKWGVVADLASPAGRERLDALLVEADVVVHNFTGEIAARLGVEWERVVRINPRIVHLTLSGFGPEEPERRGYDLIVQALGGIMAVTGEADGGPVKVGVPIADLTAGLYAVSAVTAALYERDRTGSGTPIHVSLYEAMLSLLSNQAAGWFLASASAERMGTEHPHVVPYGVYPTRTSPIVIAAGTDGQFRELCSVLGRPELAADARFGSNSARVAHRTELRKELEQALAERAASEWAEVLDRRGVPNGVVRAVPEALTAPEARSVRTVSHPNLGDITLAMTPIRVGGQILEPYMAPPTLGEHDRVVFPD